MSFARHCFKLLCIKIMLIIFTNVEINFWLDAGWAFVWSPCFCPWESTSPQLCWCVCRGQTESICVHTVWTQPENRLRLKREWLERVFQLDYLLESLLLLIICLKSFICTSWAMSLASFTNMNADINCVLSSPPGSLAHCRLVLFTSSAKEYPSPWN